MDDETGITTTTSMGTCRELGRRMSRVSRAEVVYSVGAVLAERTPPYEEFIEDTRFFDREFLL